MNILCEPAELIGKSENGHYKWTIGTQLGEGGFGTVWETCRQTDCEYVAKHILTETSESRSKEEMIAMIRNEVKLQRKAAEHKLAPKIIEAWFCEDHKSATVVMERVDRTLQSILSKTKSLNEFEKLTEQCLEMIENLHDLEIYHNDLQVENIMWSDKDKKFYFIDFGMATEGSPLDEDGEVQDDLTDLFNSIKRTMIRKMRDKSTQKEYLRILANINPLICAR